MKTKFLTTVAVLALSLSAGAQASFTSTGDFTVYDSKKDLTWAKDANISNGTMDWDTAAAWAEGLVYGGHSDWVLPTIDQLTYQFTINLGQPEYSQIKDLSNANISLFSNIQNFVYWSGSEYSPGNHSIFYGNEGTAYYQSNSSLAYAWAVRPGNDPAVAAVPVPGAIWLFGSALVGLMGLKRRRNIG